MIASASARRAAAIVSPSASIPSRSSTTSIRATVASMAADPGRTFRSALAAPRIVARRANGRCVRSFPAASASVTAPSWACAGDPTIASSRIAATPSPPPRTSMSTRTSGSRRWSTTRHTSPSQRIGARNPAPAARSSRGRSAARTAAPGAAPPASTASGSPSSSRAAWADSCWSSCAAPMTDPTEVITSPANWRKNRRRLGSGGVIGSAGRAGAVGWAGSAGEPGSGRAGSSATGGPLDRRREPIVHVTRRGDPACAGVSTG